MFSVFGTHPVPESSNTLETGPTPHKIPNNTRDPYRLCLDGPTGCKHDLASGVLTGELMGGDGPMGLGPGLLVLLGIETD